jgi:hypothetical protein
MVVLYTTNLRVDTTALVKIIPLVQGIIRVEKRGEPVRGESKRDHVKRRTKTGSHTTGFGHNSMTLVMLNNGGGTQPEKEITIKLFQNGVFHLTGVLDDAYDNSCMEILLNVLAGCRDALRDTPDVLQTTGRRVVLMNYTARLRTDAVPRQALYNAIRAMKQENVSVHYDPDVYPGVKVHIGPHKWIAKIFRTGKLILTGITTRDQCREFVDQLNTLLGATGLT